MRWNDSMPKSTTSPAVLLGTGGAGNERGTAIGDYQQLLLVGKASPAMRHFRRPIDSVDGQWHWVVGPEASTLFWLGGPAGTEILFADWATGEPNNAFGPGSESRLGWSEFGWNDLPASGPAGFKPGYIIEFSSVPEPLTSGLFGLGLAGLGLMRRLFRQTQAEA
jgi:PEP-CTERM motif